MESKMETLLWKYNIFNTPIFTKKNGLNEWFNDSLINTSLVLLLDESAFLKESLDFIFSRFFNSHLSPPSDKTMQWHKRYLKRQLLSKDDLHYFDHYYVYVRTINFHPSISEIIWMTVRQK